MKHSQRGFTLVEAIVVIVVLGVAGVIVGTIQGRIFNGQSSVRTLQVGSRLMQECAEQVLATRRFAQDGYETVTPLTFGTNLCGGVTALSGNTIPSVSFTDPYTGAGCPTNGICKVVSITQGGMTPLTLLLVDY